MRQKFLLYFTNIILLLFFFYTIFYRWGEITLFGVLDDEFGYWGNAAIIGGFNWKSLMAESPYYGMGYSIIISPLMKIDNYVLRYHFAIIINAFVLIGSFICSLYIYSAVDKNSPKWETYIKCAISVMTVNSISQARIAWAETLLSFLVWCSLALIICCLKSCDVWKIIVIVTIDIFMILVHQRALPIVLLEIIFMCFLLSKKQEFKKLVFLLVLFCSLYVLYKYARTIQISEVFSNSQESGVNNISLSSDFVSSFIQRKLTSLSTVSISLLGKVIVALLSTYFLVCPMVIYFCKEIKHGCLSELSYVRILILVSFMTMIILTAVQSSGMGRKDFVVYSRYYDHIVGPVILWGFYDLKNLDKRVTTSIYFSAIITTIGEIFVVDYMAKSNGDFNYICSTIFGGLLLTGQESNMSWVEYNSILCKYTILSSVICALLIRVKDVNKKIVCYISLLIMSMLLANKVTDQVCYWRTSLSSRSLVISEVVDSSETLYYLGNHDDTNMIRTLQEYQFINRDTMLQRIELNEIDSILNHECFIIADHKLDNVGNPVSTIDEYQIYHFPTSEYH